MYVVIRESSTIIIDIFKHKNKEKYSFINITKQHICPCEFNSKEEALSDLEKYKDRGIIKQYFEINLNNKF